MFLGTRDNFCTKNTNEQQQREIRCSNKATVDVALTTVAEITAKADASVQEVATEEPLTHIEKEHKIR